MIGAVSAASDTSSDDVVNQDISNEDNNHNTNTNDNYDVVAEASTQTADTKSVDDEIKKEETNNKISSSKNKGDLLKDTNTPGTFSELQTNITNTPNDGTINLNKDYNYDTEVSYKGIIIENKKITINGNGHTLDAKGQSRIFTLKNAILILDNLKIINGKAEYDGTDDYSGLGGAIFIDEYSTLNITNSQFNSNQAYGGGAITNYCGTLTVINTTFNQNQADSSAGAIENDGTLTVINTTFNQNQAKSGGAIDQYDVDANMKVINSLFNKNTATVNGDGILNQGGHGSVENCVFIGNAITDIGGGSTTTPGTKFIDDIHSFTALNARITTGNPNDHIIELTNNYTYDATSESDQEFIYGIPIMKDVTIKSNGHTINGSQKARIFNISKTGDLTLTNITITGGVLAILNEGTLTINNSNLTQNNATYCGGAIHIQKGGLVYINNTQLNNNHTIVEPFMQLVAHKCI